MNEAAATRLRRVAARAASHRAAASSTSLRKTAWSLAAVLLVAGTDAHADNMGRGIGAFRGAIIGDMIGGGAGAAAGAAVGAMVGAPETVAREQEHMEQKQAEADQRLAQWEADRRARELAAIERQEQAARLAAADSGPNLDLLLDTQRALMTLGYDPGPIGIQSAELTTSIVQYQESQGLVPDGRMTQDLVDRMLARAP
jgi:uncharacterized protein YcfJ